MYKDEEYSMQFDHIRNFCIIAHIDHGKSTLADRFLEVTKTVSQQAMKNQVLDDMGLERERGITIKAHAIQMQYTADDEQEYELNLIDTPGHVDFAYEVSRSLAACEGALLIVDAAQGIEAQTLSNLYLAMEHDLAIIPVVNKIDLPSADVEKVSKEIEDILGIDQSEILPVSAKYGTGVDAVLKAIVERVHPPEGEIDAPSQALIFDSVFDPYRGVIAYVRMIQGTIRGGEQLKVFANSKTYEADEVGILKLTRVKQKYLEAGDVGYIIPGAKDVGDIRVGDTITTVKNISTEPLPGYQPAKSMVFAGVYPAASADFELLKTSLEKLILNDASIVHETESSEALGFGFRCGFLGLLHKEIVQERLEREYDLNIVTTIPNVEYQVNLEDGTTVAVDNPSMLPDQIKIKNISEPYVKAQILSPADYIGNIMKLCQDRRGDLQGTSYISPERVVLTYMLPLAEIVYDFYDRLKSITRGYASFDYDFHNYQVSPLVKLDIMINGDPVDALSLIVHDSKAYSWGRQLSEKLRQLIPRQLFEVAIQAAIGNKVIARETVHALRKNVTAKCYGGDISRKRKLLEKQKAGKKRMKQVGRVEIPQEAFLAMLNVS
jgi:GTP-binding protein LepA